MSTHTQDTQAIYNMISNLQLGGIYKHYKGQNYLLLTISRSAEDLSWWVVYECQYENEASPIWHRRLEEFCGTVEVDGKEVPRFEFTGEYALDSDFNEEEGCECGECEECEGCDDDECESCEYEEAN